MNEPRSLESSPARLGFDAGEKSLSLERVTRRLSIAAMQIKPIARLGE